MKRCIDFVLALLALAVLSWLIIGIAVVYAMIAEKRILFFQRRTGKDGNPFTLYKFRTLSSNQSLSLEERQFRWGKFLRWSSLDELPQLINVLKGDMSLVGPRPLPLEYGDLYNKKEARRHVVKPGITGLAQISGRNSISWERKFKLDLYYVDHLSFLLDIKIMARTLIVVLALRKDFSLKEEKFTGNE